MAQTIPPPAPKRRRRLAIVLAVAGLALAYTAYDLYAPRTSDMRDFDPDEVARLETAMWRSYYGRERAKLFLVFKKLLFVP